MRCTVDELKVAVATVARATTANGVSIPANVVLGLGNEFVHQDVTASFLRDQKFVHRLLDAPGAGVDGASKGPSIIERLSNAASQAEAAVVVESVLKALIGAAIGIDVEDVDASKPLPKFGGKLSFLFFFMCIQWKLTLILISGLVKSRRNPESHKEGAAV